MRASVNDLRRGRAGQDIAPPRSVPNRNVDTGQVPKERSMANTFYPAPLGGLDVAKSRGGSPEGTALVLENLMPTRRGLVPRAGSRKVFTAPPTEVGGTERQKFRRFMYSRLTKRSIAVSDTHIVAFNENSTDDTFFNNFKGNVALNEFATKGDFPDVGEAHEVNEYVYYRDLSNEKLYKWVAPSYVEDTLLAGVTVAANDRYFYRNDNQNYYYNADTSAWAPSDGRYMLMVETGHTSSDFSYVEVQNSGGSFMVMVNGVDAGYVYNVKTDTFDRYGSVFNENLATTQIYTEVSTTKLGQTTVTRTIVDTSQFKFVWTVHERLFFILKGSFDVYYLEPLAHFGEAKVLPMSQLFNNSSEMLMGGQWSQDTGDGMDDMTAFITKEGEIAIFSGSNPNTASTWQRTGTFQIPPPLGDRAWTTVGGDLIIGTIDGLIPLSAVREKDVAEIKLFSVSEKVDNIIDEERFEYETAVSRREENIWSFVKSENLGIGVYIGPQHGQDPRPVLVQNLRTKGWCTFTGWKVIDMVFVGDNTFFTDGDHIYQGFVTGNDDGNDIKYRVALPFDDFGDPYTDKQVTSASMFSRAGSDMNILIDVATDRNLSSPGYPDSSVVFDLTQTVWDQAVWDVSKWSTPFGAVNYLESQGNFQAPCKSVAIQATFKTNSGASLRMFIEGFAIYFEMGKEG